MDKTALNTREGKAKMAQIIMLVELMNALCTTGLNTQTTDKDVGTLPFEFVGHADDVSSTELPIKILFFGAAA